MAPRFWYRDPGRILRRIGPLAPGVRQRGAEALEVPVSVISVSNLSRHGTGKTPTVIALAQRLTGQGRAVHVVSQGPLGPRRIDERNDDPAVVGDEALLIAAFAPSWIAADRRQGVLAAAQAGAEVIVVDGAAPHLEARPGRRILVEDAVRGFGNGYAWPLGPLKRPIQPGLSDADLLITIGPDKAQAAFRARWAAALPCPHVSAHLEPLPTGMDWAGLEVVAFAGIGAPERFFATLRGLGARLVATHALEDHRELTPALLIRLQREAAAHGAQLVTTEKDAVRLPAEFRHMVVSLPVRLELEDWQAFDRLMV